MTHADNKLIWSNPMDKVLHVLIAENHNKAIRIAKLALIKCVQYHIHHHGGWIVVNMSRFSKILNHLGLLFAEMRNNFWRGKNNTHNRLNVERSVEPFFH